MHQIEANQERAMIRHLLSRSSAARRATWSVVAAIAWSMSVMTSASAVPAIGGNIIDHHHVRGFVSEILSDDSIAPSIEPDPTDDGNIIIECVAFDGMPAMTKSISLIRLASMPQHPLGPAKCAPPDLRHAR
jgi:hypothetical protein